ncbi:rod shape-determining protein MreD [Ameyamaea chiangmaiensis NBRC 103196]|uniref:Rod shape-determining protein MreD n=1 Tax=Ameyamaea chiangmaiensis TaxID=442969 RepID=A0A850PCA7_9PROT|nr:hypothetical protein [Ameyamaea chiangmaiensis]MBS4075775.1 hypothetical protein [Ameyamaea chiangmaiensis]NVN41588.1 hypothetical protein [Ameyamaea chiangmaiensis]GBQ63705.1 rod shape-determining protein MreD [Ameyamaea chiangmaiensis NBRC 103196]
MAIDQRGSDLHPGISPRMTPILWLDMAFRRSLPGLFTLVAVIVLSAPLGVPGQAEILFGVTLGSVFFWSVMRPAAMPALAVFAIGLLMDLLGFLPLGLVVLVLLLAHAIAITARFSLSQMNFLALWAIFALIALGGSALEWALISAFSLRLMAPGPALFQAGLAMGLYPLLSVLFVWTNRTIVSPVQT